MKILITIYAFLSLFSFASICELEGQQQILFGARRSTLSPNRFNVNDIQVATDDMGNAVAAWTISNGSNIVLQAVTKTAGGTWPRAGDPRFQQNILNKIGFSIQEFELAMDRAGNAVVVWKMSNGTNNVIQASYRPAGGTFPIQGDPRQQANILSFLFTSINNFPIVKINAGVVAVVWKVLSGSNFVIQAAIKPATGVFEKPGNPLFQQNILSDNLFGIRGDPDADVDLLGNTVVGWRIFNDSTEVIQASIRPAGSNMAFIKPGSPKLQTNTLSSIQRTAFTDPVVFINSGIIDIFWKLIDVQGRRVLQAATIP